MSLEGKFLEWHNWWEKLISNNEKSLKIFYDALQWVIKHSWFFWKINNLDNISQELISFSKWFDSFATFATKYWVIKKGSAYYIVDDIKYIWKIKELNDSFDESIIVSSFSTYELTMYRNWLARESSDVKNKVSALLRCHS